MLPPVGLLAPARFVGGVARHAAGPWGPYPILLRLLEATGRRGRAPKRRPIRQSPRPGAAAARRPKRPTRRLRPDPDAPRATRTALSAALKNARLRARWVARAKRGRNHGCLRGPPRARIEPASFAELPLRARSAISLQTMYPRAMVPESNGSREAMVPAKQWFPRAMVPQGNGSREQWFPKAMVPEGTA